LVGEIPGNAWDLSIPGELLVGEIPGSAWDLSIPGELSVGICQSSSELFGWGKSPEVPGICQSQAIFLVDVLLN